MAQISSAMITELRFKTDPSCAIVFKCEATANSVTGHVCVNSKIDKNYNPKQNTGKSKDIMRYAQKNIMKICIFKYEIVLTQNEKRANI